MRAGALLTASTLVFVLSAPCMGSESGIDDKAGGERRWQTIESSRGSGKLIAAGTKRVSVTSRDLPAVPLYPNAFYYKKGSQKQSLGTLGMGEIKYVKFLTHDNVSKVYSYYVGALKRGGYRFLKGADKNGFMAQSAARKTLVSVKYRALDNPADGTQVGIAQCYAPKGAPHTIMFGISKWLPPGVMKEWKGK